MVTKNDAMTKAASICLRAKGGARARVAVADVMAWRWLCRDSDASSGFCDNRTYSPSGPVAARRVSAAPKPCGPGPQACSDPEPTPRAAMAASTASQRPVKGILKNKASTTSSVGTPAEQALSVEEKLRKKSQRWDEMNILATYHPADKDYGLMKVDEPSTPYSSSAGEDEDAHSDSEATVAEAPEALVRKLTVSKGLEPGGGARGQESLGEEEGHLSQEEREKKRQFEMKRKLHYNEGLNMKLARQLLSKDLEEEEDEDVSGTAVGESTNIEESNQKSTASDQLQNTSQYP